MLERRRMVLYMEVTKYLNVYSSMFEHMHGIYIVRLLMKVIHMSVSLFHTSTFIII